MKRTLWLTAARAALALGSAAAPLSAAPYSLKTDGDAQTSIVEQVRHRCHWHRGVLYCPSHRPRYRYYDYGPGYGPGYGPYYGPGYGSGYYGPGPGIYGPGFGLYFGGRGPRW